MTWEFSTHHSLESCDGVVNSGKMCFPVQNKFFVLWHQGDETATLNSNHFLENDTLVEVVVGLWGHSLKNRAPPQKKQIRKVQRVEETELCYQCACCLVSHRNAKLWNTHQSYFTFRQQWEKLLITECKIDWIVISADGQRKVLKWVQFQIEIDCNG